jgi:hypothetical protein
VLQNIDSLGFGLGGDEGALDLGAADARDVAYLTGVRGSPKLEVGGSVMSPF